MWLNLAAKLVPGIIKTGMSIAANRRKTKELESVAELKLAEKWTNEHTKQLPFSIATAMNAAVQGSKFISGSKQRSALQALANQSSTYL